MNPIITRPAGGWTTETVPTERGRPFTTFDGDALEPERWTGYGDDALASFNANDSRVWHYNDYRASDADVRAAIAQGESDVIV